MSDSVMLVRDVLDQPMVGTDERPCGTVDGVVLELASDGTLRVAAIEQGAVTLARRLSDTFGRFVHAVAARVGPRGGEVVRIPFDHVWGVGARVLIAGGVERERLVAVEDWARENVIARIPGA
jgi:sporulation protein YlmC with PRC-barrel domain